MSEKKASDQSSPFVRNSRNWTYHAPYATSSANRIRPAREFGVVRGIRDHEEREEQQRAALQAMERNRERLAQPERAPEDERHVERR